MTSMLADLAQQSHRNSTARARTKSRIRRRQWNLPARSGCGRKISLGLAADDEASTNRVERKDQQPGEAFEKHSRDLIGGE
jgi:hypothetical protein